MNQLLDAHPSDQSTPFGILFANCSNAKFDCHKQVVYVCFFRCQDFLKPFLCSGVPSMAIPGPMSPPCFFCSSLAGSTTEVKSRKDLNNFTETWASGGWKTPWRSWHSGAPTCETRMLRGSSTKYGGWKTSCTTLGDWNPRNNGVNHLTTGAGVRNHLISINNCEMVWFQGSWAS